MLSDGTRTYTWEHGRQLKTLTQNETTWTYTYDTNGLRTSRSNGVVTYEYYYTGTQLSWMRYLHNENSIETDLWLQFSYNAAGVPLGVTVHNGNLVAYYYYITNIQGDVIGIVSNSGTKDVTYVYDAWGNLIEPDDPGEDTIAAVNPLRYRGYVYDQEIGLYYLQSRYYNPEIGRFISADDVSYLGADGSFTSYNLFAYCGNNPVNRFDKTGNWSLPNWAQVAIGATVIIGLAVATVFTGGTAGVIIGAALTGAVSGGIGGAISGAITGGISGGWEGALDGACSGFMYGSLIGGATSALTSGLSIARGAIKVVGSAQKTGTLLHRAASNIEAGKMSMQFWKYSKIALNRSLNTAGLVGRRMPDVIGIARNGTSMLIEVVSKSQTTAQMTAKCLSMIYANPGAAYKVIDWAAKISRLFQ